MKYFWARDRKHQKQFQYLWDYGDQNDGDYFTKHHPTHYHKTMRPRYITDKLNLLSSKLTNLLTYFNNFNDKSTELQGCVDTQYHRDN